MKQPARKPRIRPADIALSQRLSDMIVKHRHDPKLVDILHSTVFIATLRRLFRNKPEKLQRVQAMKMHTLELMGVHGASERGLAVPVATAKKVLGVALGEIGSFARRNLGRRELLEGARALEQRCGKFLAYLEVHGSQPIVFPLALAEGIGKIHVSELRHEMGETKFQLFEKLASIALKNALHGYRAMAKRHN